MTNVLVRFSKVIVYLMAFAALMVCVILLPELARESSVENPATALTTYLFLASSYILFVPFFVALHYTHKFLGHLNSVDAFSGKSVADLRTIKYCANIFSGMIVVGVACMIGAAKSANPSEDVTHIAILGIILAFIPIVIALFIAVLQRLLQEAIAMKAENDLIV